MSSLAGTGDEAAVMAYVGSSNGQEVGVVVIVVVVVGG